MIYTYIAYPLVALFISWIWIDYYRLIDIYGKEDLKYIVPTFLMGGASAALVLAISIYLLPKESAQTNDVIYSIMNCIFRIGLIEEIAKAIPFFIALLLFRKHLTDPIDYLAFICFSALGFAAAENSIYFFDSPINIGGRSILSTVGHMFDSSIIAYGLIIMRFKKKKFDILLFIGSILLAAIFHGLYDFFIYQGAGILAVLFFLFFISVFTTFINNALNNSSNFSYKKVLNDDNIDIKLTLYYIIVFFFQLLLVSIYTGSFIKAFRHFASELWTSLPIVVMTIMGLTRLKLIQGRWNKIKLELPFTFTISNDPRFGPAANGLGLKFKGEGYNDSFMGNYYEEYFYVYPVSKTSYISKKRVAYIEKKIFLKDDESFFVAKLFMDETREKFEYVLLKAKAKGKTQIDDKYNIVALLRIHNMDDLNDTSKTSKDFGFLEWVYIKPIPQQKAA